jgi:Predicted transcriptional regulator, contains C-terminal CBS domains
MLRLREIMTTGVITATPDMTLRDAMELISERHIGGVPVMEGKRVVGIFSATDLIAYIAELSEATASLTFAQRRKRTAPLEDVTVGDVMTRKVQSLPPDSSVEEAAWLMAEKRIHRILVMEEGELLGVATVSDVAKAVADHRIKTRTYVFA